MRRSRHAERVPAYAQARGVEADLEMAVVARELGIPAVVNCGDATACLHTGDRVRVHGAAGVVEMLEAG